MKRILIAALLVILLTGCATTGTKLPMLDDLLYRYYRFNSTDNIYGWDLLHYYSAVGTKAEVELALDYSGNIDAKDNSGRTPLMVAYGYENHNAVEALLDAGAVSEEITHERAFPDIDKPGDMRVPDLDYQYFKDSDKIPFEVENISFSYHNAWWLSECSFLAYASAEFAEDRYYSAGLNNFKFFQNNYNEAMVSWDDEKIIIAFRGTEHSDSSWDDILTDIRVRQTSYPKGGYVHRGFYEAFNYLWEGENGLKVFIDGLKSEDEDRAIWITGHSMGGALAAICFTELEEAMGVYTYGAPRVGNGEFLELTKDRAAWRIEHSFDPIPKVPHTLSTFDYYYYNLGDLIFIDKFGEVYDLSDNIYSLSRMNYQPAFVDRDKPKIADHTPSLYSVKLWNKAIAN